ncbi:sugar kinase [Myxococcota bacterium]|nr:sugar kinase [Myxococcota bacterium]MBU1534655.1 sugar kinase [Myxococcota bacterium]
MNLQQRIASLRSLSVGQVTHDRYCEAIVPGGCAFFGARCALGLGARSDLLTAVGDDFLCAEDLAGLTLHMLTGGSTTVFTNSYPEGGLRVQHVETQARDITTGDLPKNLCNPDLLFLAPVMGEIDPSDPWQQVVQAAYTTLSLQGFLKKGESGHRGRRVVVKDDRIIPDQLFQGVDALFFSEEDLDLFGSPQLFLRLRDLVPLIFVTAGERGCTVYSAEKVENTGIFPTTTVDPTGAGDTFAMATSLGLAAGLSARHAALLGSAAASVVVEDQGSRSLGRIGETYRRFEALCSS